MMDWWRHKSHASKADFYWKLAMVCFAISAFGWIMVIISELVK